MGWQIAVAKEASDGLTSLMSTVLPSILAGLAALGGVYVGGREQRRAAAEAGVRHRQERLDDRRAEDERTDARLNGDRAFAKLRIAFHLEAYAKACAEALSYNSQGLFRQLDDAMAVPDFPPWPEVPWELLGASETGAARDIEARVALRMAWVQGDIDMSATDAADAREYYSNGAARIGSESWHVATRLREEAGVPPFEFPDNGWNYVETLLNHIKRLESQRKEWLAAKMEPLVD